MRGLLWAVAVVALWAWLCSASCLASPVFEAVEDTADLEAIEAEIFAFRDSFEEQPPSGRLWEDKGGFEPLDFPFAGNLTFIQPNRDFYDPNSILFVASGGEGSSSTPCGDVMNPCSSLALAFTLTDNVILMPGTHFINETVGINMRNVTIVGLLGANDTRPRIAAAAGSDFGNSPGLLFFAYSHSVILDSIEISSWRCTSYCLASAVNAYAVDWMTVSNCRFADNKKEKVSPLSGNVPQYFASVLSSVPDEDQTPHILIRDSSFEGNEAYVVADHWVHLFGAAVFVYGGYSEVSNCSFSMNSVLVDSSGYNGEVPARGAAISAYYCEQISVSGCSFVYNGISAIGGQVAALGGALSTYHSRVTVSACIWDQNYAEGANSGNVIGGAIAVEYGSISLTNCAFFDNLVFAAVDSHSYTGGGALGMYGSSLVVSNCTFADNSVTPRSSDVFGGFGYGGALFIYCGSRGTVSVSDSSFLRNRVARTHIAPAYFVGTGAYGGALSISSLGSATVDVNRCSFVNNTVAAGRSKEGLGGSAGGGAVATQTDSTTVLTIRDCSFLNNEAQGGIGMFGSSLTGGGALLTGVPATVIGCNFTGNSAYGGDIARGIGGHRGGTGGGGAIVGFTSMHVASSRFTANFAIGGGLLKERDVLYSGSACGGAVLVTSDFVMEDCIVDRNSLPFTNNTKTTTLLGGAIVVMAGVEARTIALLRTNFIGNSMSATKQLRGSKLLGGAMMITGSNATLLISDSLFHDNHITADRTAQTCGCYGGALYLRLSGVLHNVTFTENTIESPFPSYGGAIALPEQDFSLSNVTIRANGMASRAGRVGLGAGGGMYIYLHTVDVSQVVLEDNFADYGGGVLYWRLPGDLAESAADGMFLSNNTASVAGGGIYFEQNSWDHTISCPVEGPGNTAGYGNECASNVFNVVFAEDVPTVIWPGQTMSVVIILIDAFSNTAVIPGYSIIASATAPIDTGAAKDTVLPSEEGLYLFPRTRVFSESFTTVELRFTVEALNALLEQELQLPAINATVAVLSCPADHYASSDTLCTPCEQANYNFDGTKCRACPDEGVQCVEVVSENGLLLRVLEGYYPSSFVNPSALTPCPNRDSCPGYSCETYVGEDTQTWTLDCSACPASTAGEASDLDCMCAAGYTGRLCSECLFTENVCFFRSGDECLDSDSLPLGLWGPWLELIAYCAVTVFWLSLRQDAERGSAKTLVFYVQTVAALCDNAFAPFGALNLLASVTSGVVLTWLNVASLRCLSYELFSAEVVDMAVLSLMPLLLFWPCTVLVHMASAAYHHWRAKRAVARSSSRLDLDDVSRALLSESPRSSPQGSPRGPSISSSLSSSGGSTVSSAGSSPESPQEFDWKDHVKDASFHSLLYVLHSSFFNVCNLLFASWGCVKDPGTGEWYSPAIHMPWMACSADSGWMPMLIVSFLLSLLLVVGPLALFITLLRRHRHELSDPAVFRRMGFLYGSYREEVYWWELVALGRRLLLSLTLAMFALDSPLYSSGAVTILCASVALQFHFKPFTTHRENMLEIVCLVTIIASFQASQFLTTLSALDSFGLWVTQIGVLAVNGLILIYLATVVGMEVIHEFKPKAETYLAKLRASTSMAGLDGFARKAGLRPRRSPSVQTGL